ncbi:receptor-interacting serine/threonine-protein kinase 4-like [Belonocnema kinseyi]|uniref:receptor-interacting serine/threonine-protein kinase 4-like n=1 Tax=Belonocnema kinseyi TaxID=2817044 RepID=UPI00143DB6F6|nr:receptor-interacting serine/threonine-protein kinase 4-like [Belonocnema kinseyi]
MYQFSVNSSGGLPVVAMLVKRMPVDFEVIKISDYFISIEQSINNKSWPCRFTLLHFAAQFGNTDIIPVLLARKSHLNPKSKIFLTPLHVAALHGQSQVIRILLRSGAKHDMKDNDAKTPLCWAIEKSSMESMQILLKKTLDPRHSSMTLKNDKMLMYCAAIRGNEVVI